MSGDDVSEVLLRIARAHAAIHASGEFGAIGQAGRAPSRSEAFQAASAELHAAKQARNRLFVEKVGDAETVPIELTEGFGLTGREAASLIEVARGGPRRLREHLLGESDAAETVWTSESRDPA
ncbi:hypothetical protein [Nocardia altamirensis]|uniref:hypothetical protein n=1 Tax=Nocardia altamirensis TaxID=472158 RepID=UPI00084043BA|nr:hypothetical protein [Nocardia altamirensis]